MLYKNSVQLNTLLCYYYYYYSVSGLSVFVKVKGQSQPIFKADPDVSIMLISS